MKNWIILPLILLSACSHPRPGRIAVKPMPASMMPDDKTGSIRYPEALKPYPIGRYVDPNNPMLMHERHTLYRVEAMPTWNLHTGPPWFPPLIATQPNAAFAPPPFNDEIAAEINRQKIITQLVGQETSRLNSSLQNLNEALATTRTVAQQNLQLRQQLFNAEKRIESLETNLARIKSTANGGNMTNEVSPLSE
jgi:hypothetical protein